MLIFRVAMSEQFRSPPDAIRAWPVRDLVHALLLLEMVEGLHREERERQATKHRGGA